MRRRIAVRLLVAAISVVLVTGVAAGLAALSTRAVTGAAPEPGSPEDPLITKGYFDRYVALVVVNLPAGGKLVCEAGTEIVLRAGRATAMGSPLGGLADVTAGKDVQTGQPVSPNHLLIVPRNDGRGLQAVTDCILMVRGPYTTAP